MTRRVEMKRWNDYGKQHRQADHRWHQHIRYFYAPTTDILRGLADLYVDALETAELERLIAEDEANEGKNG